MAPPRRRVWQGTGIHCLPRTGKSLCASRKANPQAAFNWWMNDPPTAAEILNANVTEFGDCLCDLTKQLAGRLLCSHHRKALAAPFFWTNHPLSCKMSRRQERTAPAGSGIYDKNYSGGRPWQTSSHKSNEISQNEKRRINNRNTRGSSRTAVIAARASFEEKAPETREAGLQSHQRTR